MNDKKTHCDQLYIVGLLNNDSIIVKEIYEKFAPKVIHYISRNSGNEHDANDIIQEVLITIYHQAQKNNFKLTCPFDAYFFLLCKRMWFNVLKKTSKKEVTINEEILSINDDASLLAFETIEFDERQQLFEEMFQKLGKACKDLLKASFTIKSLQEVADKLGVSYGYVRKKKSLCVGKLTKLVQGSPVFKKIKN